MTGNNSWWMTYAPPRDTAWMEYGVCRQVDPELWHPEKGRGDSSQAARAICGRCPVRVECLEYALAQPGIMGIFGGTTESQRRRIIDRQRGRRAA